MMSSPRSTLQERVRAKLLAGSPILGAVAGTAASARCEEACGVDLIVLSSSGRFAQAGPGSLGGLLPYGNANEIVKEMAREILSAVQRTPVLAGVCGTDPLLLPSRHIAELQQLGFSGIQNTPTVGLIDGQFRKNLDETGIRFDLEIACVAEAHAMGMLTVPNVFDADQAGRMADAGADLLVAHMGLSLSGTDGAAMMKTLPECVDEIRRIADAARARREDVDILCHGGPLLTAEDVQFVLDRCPEVVGYHGLNAAERPDPQAAIAEEVRSLAGVKLSRPRGKRRPLLSLP